LSSGLPATIEVEDDLLNYVQTGRKACASFIENRLENKVEKFHDRMKRLNLKTFTSMAVKCKLTSSQKKTVEIKAERNLFGHLLMLSQTKNISLDKLFEYPLGPVPWSLGTADGGLVKTNKSQLMHCLEEKVDCLIETPAHHSTYVIDGNALLHAMVSLPATFAELATTILQTLPQSCPVHFVTDTYKTNSIKDFERQNRGVSSNCLIGGPKTKLPRDFKSFLCNSENKRNFIRFLLSEWTDNKNAQYMQAREVFLSARKNVSI
jgi:hypothetical protein